MDHTVSSRQPVDADPQKCCFCETSITAWRWRSSASSSASLKHVSTGSIRRANGEANFQCCRCLRSEQTRTNTKQNPLWSRLPCWPTPRFARRSSDAERRGRVASVDMPALLRAWAASYDVFKINAATPMLAPNGAADALGRLAAIDGAVALTGSFAAVRLAPVAAPALLLVYCENVERRARAWGCSRHRRAQTSYCWSPSTRSCGSAQRCSMASAVALLPRSPWTASWATGACPPRARRSSAG